MSQSKRLLVFSAMFSLSLPGAATIAYAEHAVINLEVISPDKSIKARADEEPPPGGSLPRPRMTVKAGDSLVLQYILINVYPHGVVKKVNVRYFVVRVDEFDQKTVPPLEAKEGDPAETRIQNNVVTKGHVVMNFKPKCRVGGRLLFRVPKPGIYLVRIDTQNTDSDHEHFAAIDLEVR